MPPITLTITLDSNGQVQVNGPIDQAILAYGLLEAAKNAVTAFHNERQRLVKVVPANTPIAVNGA